MISDLKMSSSDRPATQAFKERWNNLLAFWKERQRGLYDKDFTTWRMEMGLTPRTAKENYWQAGETLGYIRTIFEKGRKFWEHCASTDNRNEATVEHERQSGSEKTQRLSKTAMDFFERMKIREKMKAGPCKHNCGMGSDTDCRTCDTFRSLRSKTFLENTEEA